MHRRSYKGGQNVCEQCRDTFWHHIHIWREIELWGIFFSNTLNANKSYGLYSEKNYFWLNFPSKAFEVPVVGAIILVCFSYFLFIFFFEIEHHRKKTLKQESFLAWSAFFDSTFQALYANNKQLWKKPILTKYWPAHIRKVKVSFLTQLLHIWVEVYTGDCIPVPLEVPLQGWVLLQRNKQTNNHVYIEGIHVNMMIMPTREVITRYYLFRSWEKQTNKCSVMYTLFWRCGFSLVSSRFFRTAQTTKVL